jgi:hypothetical protein
MPLISARAAYIQQEQIVEAQGWKGTLQMSTETVAGLSFYLDNFKIFDNTTIRTAAN